MIVLGPDKIPEPLHGVTYDAKNCQYLAFFDDNTIGFYKSSEAAAYARDCEILLLLTLDNLNNNKEITTLLNYQYTLTLSNDPKNDDTEFQIYDVTDKSNNTFKLYLTNEAFSLIKKIKLDNKFKDFNSKFFLPLTATPSDHNKRWVDRMNNSYAVAHPFTFELTFHNTGSLGITLQSQYISYSSGGGYLRMGCCVATEITIEGIRSIIQPGDFLLKVNDKVLISIGIESVTFDSMIKLIKEASSPRTIRFMRLAGSAYNLLPSPVEINMLSVDSQVSAKFNVLASQANTPMTPTLSYLDPNAPQYVKKLMQGSKGTWEVGNISNVPISQPIETRQSSKLGGIYKDRGKTVAIAGRNSKLVCLGRYDKEEEAYAAYKRGTSEIHKIEEYTVKRLRLLSKDEIDKNNPINSMTMMSSNQQTANVNSLISTSQYQSNNLAKDNLSYNINYSFK